MVKDCVSFNLKTRGASHVAGNLPCQDSCLSIEGDGYTLLCVCDGHGGADYFRSERGSAFATEEFSASMAEKGEDILKMCACRRGVEDILRQFYIYFLLRWENRIKRDVAENPFSEDEMIAVSERRKEKYLYGEDVIKAYGTTFIGAVLTDDFWFAIQVGDGDCVFFDSEGHPFHPIAEDDDCIGNVTTSLCDDNAMNEARFFFSREQPASVFISSDGVRNSFNGNEAMYYFYGIIMREFKNGEIKEAYDALSDYLPRLSEKGSRDDISMAVMMNTSMIKTENIYEDS